MNCGVAGFPPRFLRHCRLCYLSFAEMTLLNQLAVILPIKIQKGLIPIERTQASKTEVKSKFDHKRTRQDLLTSPSQGRIQDFSQEGCTSKEWRHWQWAKKFLKVNTYIRNFISGGGAHPLHPPPRSAPASCHWNEHFQHHMRRRWKIKLVGKKLSAQLIHIKKNATSNESHL